MRVVTWNVWYRFGAWRRRLEAIRKVLNALAPDLCALQEVWCADGGGLPEILASDLNLRCVQGVARNQAYWQQRVPEPGVRHGAAILSRWPIRESSVDVVSEIHGRTALSARIDTPGGSLCLVSAHLSSRGGDEFRRIEAQRLVGLVRNRSRDADRTILTGDFNAAPGSETLQILTRDFVDVADFADGAGPTWIAGDADAGQRPAFRIDYILVGRHEIHPPVRSVTAWPAEPVEGMWPSDHVAVVADFADFAEFGGDTVTR